MDKFLKFVEGELTQFPISQRLDGFCLVQVWASPMMLNEIIQAAAAAGVGITDLKTSLFLYPQEEEEEASWPPF